MADVSHRQISAGYIYIKEGFIRSWQDICANDKKYGIIILQVREN
jgi:hypothetical protein